MVSKGMVKQASRLVVFTIIPALAVGVAVLDATVAAVANPVSSPASFTPPKTGTPTDTRSGTSRGDVACFPNQHQEALLFTPLVPPSSHGLTRLSHPSFFVYLPPTSAQELFFSLKDEQQQVQYQTRIKISGHEGILRIRLPQTVSPLEVGKRYQWIATLRCSRQLSPDSPFVMGWIERTAPIKAGLNLTSEPQSVDSYYLQNIWYDSIESLANLKQQQPRDSHLASTWKKLLESVGLGAIAVAPLLTEP